MYVYEDIIRNNVLPNDIRTKTLYNKNLCMYKLC